MPDLNIILNIFAAKYVCKAGHISFIPADTTQIPLAGFFRPNKTRL